MSAPLLTVDGLTKVFASAGRWGGVGRSAPGVRAVDDVAFTIDRGESFGLVGESGCGKSTVARCLLRLVEPTAGQVCFDGVDVATLRGSALRRARRRAQIVFQDPMGALNPRMTVADLIAEPLVAHGLVTNRKAAAGRVAELLTLVGLDPQQADRRPSSFSGGQRQRIAIARCLATEPSLLILDEPVTSLDVSIAAQILNLLVDLQAELGIAVLFISHDLSLVRHFCDRVAVMYLGTIVESATTHDLFGAPHHPYTQALLSAMPLPDPRGERTRIRIPLPGEVPSADAIPHGCRFHPRCFKATPECAQDEPPLDGVGPRGHAAACWHAEPLPVVVGQPTSSTPPSSPARQSQLYE